jgi:hypothetical protein
MTNHPTLAPPDEQQICVTCGFCCDGTLFMHATLQPGEMGNLPPLIEKNFYKEDGKEYFTLPCQYFLEKCTIYDQKKADVCSSYRCQLLKDFAENKMTMQSALEIIQKAKAMRKELMEKYHDLSGIEKNVTFRELLIELGKAQKKVRGYNKSALEYDMLIARCNIFEALLIKHIRSTSDFNEMMST